MMNKFLYLFILPFLVVGFSACSDDDTETSPVVLPVTPANLDGTWMLASWQGAPLADGTYCYVVFHRGERTFEMYQKFDSMYPRYITGSFTTKQDPRLGYVISGVYDFGRGDWAHRYIVTDLLESGVMTWTAEDRTDDVSLYVRCPEGVPADVVEASRAEEEFD